MSRQSPPGSSGAPRRTDPTSTYDPPVTDGGGGGGGCTDGAVSLPLLPGDGADEGIASEKKKELVLEVCTTSYRFPRTCGSTVEMCAILLQNKIKQPVS